MALIALEPTQELIDLVGTLGGKWTGQTALCRCPAHDDRTPSLSIRQGDQGFLIQDLRELGGVVPHGSYKTPPWSAKPPRSANVERLWGEGIEVKGTLAEIYLASRKLPSGLPDLRFHPAARMGQARLPSSSPRCWSRCEKAGS